MDGFDPNEATSETDKGVEALSHFLATKSDAFEPFQFAHGLFDPGSCPVEPFREEAWPVLDVGPVWRARPHLPENLG